MSDSAINSSESSRDPSLPRSFGRYVLFDHIGSGGMADIFLAHMQTAMGASRRVVLKQVLPSIASDATFRKMLIDEAKLSAKLNHANIVQVFDFGEEDGRLYLTMDYVEGFDLAQFLKRLSKHKVPLPAEFAILIVREMLRALDYAHRACDENGRPLGIVHRDVSPSNVLISFEGEVKLCDFGIARAFSGAASDSSVERVRVAGKSAYMAPEHASGEPVDSRTDLFAAGILIWELCAGRRLYRGTDEEMLALARAANIPPLPDRGLPNHQVLADILERALQKDPAARFQTAADFLNALEEWAVKGRLLGSPIRFATFLRAHFETEILASRRALESTSTRPGPRRRVETPAGLPDLSTGPHSAYDDSEGPTVISPPSGDALSFAEMKTDAEIPLSRSKERILPSEDIPISGSTDVAPLTASAAGWLWSGEAKPKPGPFAAYSPGWFALLLALAAGAGAAAYYLIR